MKTGGRSLTSSRERFGLRQLLVVSQVALSMVLLVSALLFSGSLRKLLAVDAGFRQNGILIVDLDFRRLKVPVAQRTACNGTYANGFRRCLTPLRPGRPTCCH